MSRTWRILSIDGGGIRGLIPLAILAEIEAQTGKPISELFDLIAGTSTGAILSLGLTKPNELGEPAFTAKHLTALYEREARHIFHAPATWLENLVRPKYDSHAGIAKVMRTSYGDSRLKDALTDVLIPCYDIENRSPHIFKSRWARRQDQFDYKISDVACAAAATPTMFEPVRLQRPIGGGPISLVDGGVFANNPSALAFAEVSRMFAAPGDKFLLVSLGTGESMERMKRKLPSDWGYVRWSIPMTELVSESNSEAIHEQMRYLLPNKDGHSYYRFQVDLPNETYYALDNPSKRNMDGLKLAADLLLNDESTKRDLSVLCDKLVRLSEQHTHVESLERLALQGGETPNLHIVKGESRAENSVASIGTLANLREAALAAGSISASSISAGSASVGSNSVGSMSAGSKSDRQFAANGTTRGTKTASRTRSAQNRIPHRSEWKTGCYEVVLCHVEDDLNSIALPLAEALEARGVTVVLDKFGGQAPSQIQRKVTHPAETAITSIVILSPSFIKNDWASKQFEWLHTRNLAGKNVLMPVIHGIGKHHVQSFMPNMKWHAEPSKYIDYLMELAELTTSHGVDQVADSLCQELHLWFN